MRRELVVILSLVVILMIIVSISNSRHKNREKEKVKEKEFFNENENANADTATLVKRQFGDEACDLLKLNNNFNSELYLRTGRFKKWKPADQTEGANSENFCYSDETSFCESDAFISPSKHQGLIKSKTITSQGQANTTVASSNKCVFEIDQSKINASKLLSFWSAVGDGNCTTLNSNLINKNGRLIRESNALSSNIRDTNANIVNQYGTIVSLTGFLEIKSASNQSLISYIDTIRPRIQQVIGDKGVKVTQMNSNIAQCAQQSNVLTASNAACQTSLSNVKVAYLQNWSNMRDLQLQFDTLKVNYDSAQRSLNSNVVILGQLNTEYNTIYNGWQRDLSNLSTSNIRLNFVKSSNQTCQSNLGVITGQIANANASYLSEYDRYKQCDSDLTGCTSMSNIKVANLNDVTFNLIPTCTNSNNACQQNVFTLNNTIESYKKTLLFSQENYRDETCAPWQGRIKALEAYSNWLVERCMKSNNNLETISNVIDSIRSNTQDKIKSCQANKSSLVGDPNSDLFIIDKHISFCSYGERCHLASYEEAVKQCPARCSNAEYNLKSVPNARGSKYVGWLEMGDDRSGCYCSYSGNQGDFEQAKADNLEALMAAGETLPRGSYRSNVVFTTGGSSFCNYFPHNCKSCIAQNKFLACDCVDVTTGLWKASMLDLSNCPLGTDITNQKGKLTCGGYNTGKSYQGNTRIAGGGDSIGSANTLVNAINPTPYERETGNAQPL